MTRPRIAGLAVAVLAVVVAASVLFSRSRGTGAGLTASGTVEATQAALGFQVAGRVAQVAVHEGDRVQAGDTLAVLDRAELEARRAQARAALAAARALLTEMERGARSEELAQARAADSATTARLSDAQRDVDRTERLQQGGAVSQEALDKARLAFDMARSAKEQADEQLRLVQSGPREERIAAQRAAVAQAIAALRQADVALANAVVTAPFSGVVTVRHREPGETVGAGAPVLTIANLDDRWVRVYISEARIGAVRLGEPATITTDTYRGKQYGGAVSFIASEAEFTPRNVQTTEERVKLVYAVKVRITGDGANDLKPGMPADVVLAASANQQTGR